MSSDFYHSLTLPHGAMCWSVVCDYGISWSYSLFGSEAVFLCKNIYSPINAYIRQAFHFV